MSIEAEVVTPVHASRDLPPPEFNESELEQEGEADSGGKEILSARDEIARKYDERKREELDSAKNPQKQVDKDNQTDTELNPSADQAPRQGEEAAPEMVEIKVHGRSIMVEKDKIEKAGGVVAYQKEVAVQQGFQDLAQQRKNLEAREQMIAQREQQLQKQAALPTLDKQQAKPQTTQNDPPAPTGDQPNMAALIKQHREALLDGDDETADNLLAELLSIPHKAQKEQGFDPDQLIQQATQQAVQNIEQRERNKSLVKARDKLYQDHPELNQDTRLFQAVDEETVKVEREHPDWEPAQILVESWNRVDQWRSGGRPERQQSASSEQKQQEKRAMSHPKAANGRAQAPPQPKVQTRSDIVNQLRAARGQT